MSLGFSVALSNASDYGATYGSYGTAIALLVYLQLSAAVVLAGAEMNALRMRERRLAARGGSGVDGCWASVGTMSFHNRSLALDDEATLTVLDPDLGRRMEALFRDDLRFAHEIDLATFRRRPRIRHLAERAADLIAPIP